MSASSSTFIGSATLGKSFFLPIWLMSLHLCLLYSLPSFSLPPSFAKRHQDHDAHSSIKPKLRSYPHCRNLIRFYFHVAVFQSNSFVDSLLLPTSLLPPFDLFLYPSLPPSLFRKDDSTPSRPFFY